jgi:hypothetical protein
MERTIYAVTLAFSCLGVVIIYWAIRARKRALAEQEKIHWVLDQANRALDMIKDEDPSNILVGLQMLSAYDIPSIRVKAIPRLIELTQYTNKQVAQLAKHVIGLSERRAFRHKISL